MNEYELCGYNAIGLVLYIYRVYNTQYIIYIDNILWTRSNIYINGVGWSVVIFGLSVPIVETPHFFDRFGRFRASAGKCARADLGSSHESNTTDGPTTERTEFLDHSGTCDKMWYSLNPQHTPGIIHPTTDS